MESAGILFFTVGIVCLISLLLMSNRNSASSKNTSDIDAAATYKPAHKLVDPEDESISEKELLPDDLTQEEPICEGEPNQEHEEDQKEGAAHRDEGGEGAVKHGSEDEGAKGYGPAWEEEKEGAISHGHEVEGGLDGRDETLSKDEVAQMVHPGTVQEGGAHKSEIGHNETAYQDFGASDNAIMTNAVNIGKLKFNVHRNGAVSHPTNPQDQALRALYFEELSARQLTIKDASEGTCAWLLDNLLYNDWIERLDGILWIIGHPGTGKSTLMKHAYENEFRKRAPVVLSFFFHKSGSNLQKSAQGLWRSLIFQALSEIPNLRQDFQRTFDMKFKIRKEHGTGWIWHENELQKFFNTSILEKYSVRVFLDGLDECDQAARQDIVTYFESVAKCPHSKISICFSSRPRPEIATKEAIFLQDENRNDISTFVKGQLRNSENTDHKNGKPGMFHEEITKKATSSFQWAYLAVLKANKRIDAGSEKEKILAELKTMPEELKALYVDMANEAIRTITNLDPEDVYEATHLIEWLCLAARPLPLKELRLAMGLSKACRLGNDIVETPDYNATKRIAYLSGGLAEVKPQVNGDGVHLIHESVDDFLIDGGLGIFNSSVREGHIHLSQACIKYATLENIVVKSTQDYPFLEYALTHWGFHAEKAASNDRSKNFPWPPIELLERWIKVYQQDKDDRRATLLHYCCENGLVNAVTQLLALESDVKFKARGTKESTSPLERSGHEHPLFSISKREVALEQCDRAGRSPLWLAAWNGHEKVVSLLLAKKVQTDPEDEDGQTPLSYAAERGHRGVVKVLLEANAKIDSRNKKGETPVWHAAGKGHSEVIEILLLRGANLDTGDSDEQTPLSWAAYNGQVECVRLLLKHKAKLDSEDKRGRTPLWYAARNGHEEVVKLLLERGANVNAADEHGWTPLIGATVYGYGGIVNVLLDYGADKHVRDKGGWTPLSGIVEGPEAIIRAPTPTNDISVDSKDRSGRTLQSQATEVDNASFANMLFDEGVDMTAPELFE